jgi:2-oxoisovalerate dehydrogenase E1 component beta subunit
MTEKNVVQTIHDTLEEEMQDDDRVVVLGEDVGARGGVFRVTAGFLDEFGERRVIDTPLAESGIVGVAIGMAMHGMLPVAEIQFADFIHPAFDQLVSEAARIRYRSNGDFGVPLVVRTPWGGGVHGALYHSQSIEAFYGHVPGLKTVVPSTPYDAKGLLRSAIRDPDPVLFLEHKKTYRLIKGEVPDEPYEVPIGVADVKREGSDLTVIAYGLMLHLCLEAAEKLSAEDAEVVATIAEELMFELDGPLVRIGGPDIPAMPYAGPLEHAFLPNAEAIHARMRELARF